MKYEIAASARADLAKLKAPRKILLRQAMASFITACDDHTDPAAVIFPGRLRVKAVQGARGVFEMTWSFAGPDGRATFEWITVPTDDGNTEPAVRWRRIGDHQIFKEP